ncbi:MAG: YqiJ family protein [Gammaproteobacteria bacterium]|nr:YqiJ family protein [Gammaproteobacteria bacterium]
MLDFITASPNLPFSVALAVMLLIALLEGVGGLLGLGFSHLFNYLTPGIDLSPEAPDWHLDSGDALSRLLGWLHVGKVPMLVLLVIFLTAFGLIGLALQATIQDLFGKPLPGWLASAATVPPALWMVRFGGRTLGRLLPGDYSEVVSEASFIGRIAVITLGTATYDSPAQAKLRDQYGQTHYVMTAPDLPEEFFSTGTQVLIVRKEGSVYRAIRNPHSVLAET